MLSQEVFVCRLLDPRECTESRAGSCLGAPLQQLEEGVFQQSLTFEPNIEVSAHNPAKIVLLSIHLQNFKAFDANVGRTTGRIWCASFWCQGKSQLEVLWIRLQSIFIRNFTFYFKSKFIYSKVKRQSILPAVMMEKKNLTLYCQHLLLGAWMSNFIMKILFHAQVPSPFPEVGIRKWSKMAFVFIPQTYFSTHQRSSTLL